MKRKAAQELKPRLRFPEFRETGDWKEQQLREFSKLSTERAGSKKCIPMSVTSGVGLVSQEEKFGRTIHGKSYKNYYQLHKNDFAFNKSATKECPQGFIARYDGDELAAVPNSIFTCFSVDDATVDPIYLEYLFLNNLHGRWLAKYITVGARAHGALNVNDDDLMALPVPLPPGGTTLDEQQRIADCLASLDELIAAHGRKLGALKAHKKGLMQQLFPRQGETQPRLRFPEFLDEPEWEKKEVGEVFKVTRGEVLSMTLVEDKKTDDAQYPVYSSQTKRHGLSGYYSDYLYNNAITWTTDGANAGDVNYRDGKFFCTNVCGVLINTAGYANPCIAALLNSVTRKHVSYVGNPKLMNGVMAKILIPFPMIDEQNRIADCLSSLDDLIATQTQKLDALKLHKKGLMQQLFPSPEAN